MANGKNLKIKSDSFLFSEVDNRRITVVFFSISIFIHGLLFIGLLFVQDFRLPKPMEPVIQIDLVSFTPDLAMNPADETAPDSTADGVPVKASTPPKPKPKPVKHIKPDISLKKKPKNLSELLAQKKKKTPPPEKKPKPKPKPEPKPQPEPEPEEKVAEQTEAQEELARQKALEDLKKRLAKEQADKEQQQIAQALERLRKGVKDKETSTAGQGRSTGYASKNLDPFTLYNMVIGSAIEQNWVFNETLARMDKNLEVRIIIKILKSGEIRDIFYETRSGNRYLDESAKRAIEKASPLPPLPGSRRSYDLGLVFTPRGLK